MAARTSGGTGLPEGSSYPVARRSRASSTNSVSSRSCRRRFPFPALMVIFSVLFSSAAPPRIVNTDPAQRRRQPGDPRRRPDLSRRRDQRIGNVTCRHIHLLLSSFPVYLSSPQTGVKKRGCRFLDCTHAINEGKNQPPAHKQPTKPNIIAFVQFFKGKKRNFFKKLLACMRFRCILFDRTGRCERKEARE